MAWLETQQSLPTHRKTGRLVRALGISRQTAVGHLIILWLWCLDNAQDGDLTRIDVEDIADGALWDGDPKVFLDGLVYAGFVDEQDGKYTIHDWMDYTGRLIELRKADAQRKRELALMLGVLGLETPEF